MKEVIIKESMLVEAASEGMDAILRVFVDAIKNAIGGELTAETMNELNAHQVTLLAYDILHEEVMDGGFIQLIHNGYGGFMFLNPVAKILKMWGLRDLSKLVYEGRALYIKSHVDLERECTDEEFMSLFEQHPEFDDLDDEFVENEEDWTAAIARYVDEHIEDFSSVEK